MTSTRPLLRLAAADPALNVYELPPHRLGGPKASPPLPPWKPGQVHRDRLRRLQRKPADPRTRHRAFAAPGVDAQKGHIVAGVDVLDLRRYGPLAQWPGPVLGGVEAHQHGVGLVYDMPRSHDRVCGHAVPRTTPAPFARTVDQDFGHPVRIQDATACDRTLLAVHPTT